MSTTGRPDPALGADRQQAARSRNSLADERTSLAWVRTSLALPAGSVAVVQLLPAARDTDGRWLAAAVLAVLAGGTAVFAYHRWEATERAMREGRPRPAGPDRPW